MTRLLCVVAMIAVAGGVPVPLLAEHQSGTRWDARPSLAFDAICLLGILGGDNFYTAYYRDDYARLAPRLNASERAAFQRLKRVIKDEHGFIVSAGIAMYFSVIDPGSLDEMIGAVRRPEPMRHLLRATPYYRDEEWQLFEQLRPDLEAALLALKRIGFPDYWRRRIEPLVRKRLPALTAEISLHDVVSAVDAVLGQTRPSRTITVYSLYFSQPHAIRIAGMRFLTHFSYSSEIVLRNAIHELMHPPYDLETDAGMAAALESLRADKFLMEHIEHHEVAYGYNSFSDFVEEDCVQALEALVSHRLGLSRDDRAYWKQQDGGMHVLAPALYQIMMDGHFGAFPESFSEFIKKSASSGRLSAGRIEEWNRRLMDPR